MSGQHTKLFSACVKAAGDATPEQLAAIRAYTLRDFTPAELMVRTFVLAHNGIDRDNECFDETLLADFSRTIAGKGCYIVHPSSWRSDGGPAEGRVFGARLETMSFDDARSLLREPTLAFPPDRQQATLLLTDVFFARTDENGALLTKMDAGIAGDVSIGFSATGPVPMKDNDGRDLSAQRWLSPGTAYEQSLVWIGAQPGARAVKTFSTENADMTPEQIKALQDSEAALKAQVATLKADGAKDSAQLASLKTALGDNATLLDNPATLAAHIVNGKTAHAALIDEIVAGERHAGILGDEQADVDGAKALYAEFPFAKLKKLAESLEARNAPAGRKAGRIAGGNPNNTAPGLDAKTKEAVEKSPLSNPALIGA
jgi:hypothetical protein